VAVAREELLVLARQVDEARREPAPQLRLEEDGGLHPLALTLSGQ
jgi:hypothetical protein